MSEITEAITKYQEELRPFGAKLVAISKTKPIVDIEEAYQAGQRVFGENKAQEMTEKSENLPQDIEWHMVGHLQRNKVKYLAPYVSLIHSVDSQRLLKEINKQARKEERVIEVLLQMHIAEEETKYGFDESEVRTLLESEAMTGYSNVRVVGLMGMATFTDDHSQVRKEFEGLKRLYDVLQKDYKLQNMDFRELSMGMSGDYKIALDCGSTMVRIGTSIFGARDYG